MLLQAADKPDRDRQLGWQQTEVQPPYWSNSGSSQSPGRRIKEKHVSKIMYKSSVLPVVIFQNILPIIIWVFDVSQYFVVGSMNTS